MKTLYIHIGTSKTGTTSLQHFCTENEKLFEELLSAEDGTEKTMHKKIFTARIKEIDKAGLDKEISKILEITDGEEVVAALQKIVPTYTPKRENI